MSEGDVRTHIVLPAQLLKDVDELVGRRKRSQFFAQLAAREVRRLRLVAAAEAAAGSLAAYDVPEWATPEQAYAWVREQRAAGVGDRDLRLWGDERDDVGLDAADDAADDVSEDRSEP